MRENDEHRSEETSQPVEPADYHSSHSRDKGRWGRPSGANLRRTAARIRSGALTIRNPELQPLELAEVLEEMADGEFFESLKSEALDDERMRRESEDQERAERERDLVAELCRLKKLPEARDPESAVAKKVRELHRLRKNELGRPRKRKKKG
jgi:hypothetical protein